MENQFQSSEILSENERNSIKEMVKNALISKEKYPVDFNDFWRWAGYSRKDSAKRTLKKFFKENKDFMIFDEFSTQFSTRKANDGRPEKGIKLTLDCAINFALKANSMKSNLVYDFILICKENFEQNNQNINLEQIDEQNSIILIRKTNTEFVVSARKLYEFLEIKTAFVKWCLRMFEYGFKENFDYQKGVTVKKDFNLQQGGKDSFIEYFFTLDCAKHIAMIQRTPKGWEAREYFIKCEKKLMQILQNPLPSLSPETTQEIFDKLKRFEDRLDTYSLTLELNFFDLIKKIDNIHSNILSKFENTIFDLWEKINKRFESLENRVSVLENKKTTLQLPKAKKVFFLMVVLDKATNYHRIFIQENPVFHTENQKMYFGELEILFSIEFERKTDCKKAEKNVFNILKMQKAHLYNDYFNLKLYHFQMLEDLKTN